jgi:hypothetical protein
MQITTAQEKQLYMKQVYKPEKKGKLSITHKYPRALKSLDQMPHKDKSTCQNFYAVYPVLSFVHVA